MRLPTPLLRRKPDVYKNQFGHVLILAGSRRMLGAGALASLSAIRSGAGLVTLGIPQSLNLTAQKKIDNVIMTLPLKETREQTLSFSAYKQVKASFSTYSVIAIGPGLSQNPSTQRFIWSIIETSPVPLIIDADALNALCRNPKVLTKTKTTKILTPHPVEMSRLINRRKQDVERNRKGIAQEFANRHTCVLLLKGNKTVVASPGKKVYTNASGNAGMATAGSGDVLTGMIAAFTAQGLTGFDAAKYGAYVHGKAGDLAAKAKTRLSMTASDIIECIPKAIQSLQ
jgi:NAD(P)H-hydrate epimerase